MTSISVIGLGGIGRPIAERLLAMSQGIVVCDLRDDVVIALKAKGARVAKRPADCAGSKAVIIVVATDSQVKDVACGPGGLHEGIDPESPPLVLIMSTVLPETARLVGRFLAGKNAIVCDTPVSGGVRGAIDGTLSIMIGGEPENVENAKPLLRMLGDRLFHCGPLGSGCTAKILNNIVSNSAIYLMSEVLRVARAMDVDTAWLANIMEASAGRNWMTRDMNKTREFYRLNTADAGALMASINITRKDLRLGLELAAGMNIECPVLEAISSSIEAQSYDTVAAIWSELAH
jgi:3-hydroxyisobutyrate dehydrogenase